MTLRLKLLGLALLAALTFAARPAAAQSDVILLSGMGGKCLDAEGARTSNGTRLIGYACSGSWNEKFTFASDGSIRLNGKCVDASGGAGRDGDGIVLWDCNGGANQKWRFSGNKLVGINGKCIDLEGGEGHWFGNQRAVLWSCSGAKNQLWYRSALVPAGRIRGAVQVQPGQKVDIRPVSAGVISAGGGNVISAGGGNVVSAGGGNVIAPGGGN